MTPKVRFSTCRATRSLTRSAGSLRSRATRSIWNSAAAGLMSGSSPLADAVTRSTGIDFVGSEGAARSASTRRPTASIKAGFVGPRFEPLEALALSPNGPVADGRAQKYRAASNGCPTSSDPTTTPSRTIRLPFAR